VVAVAIDAPQYSGLAEPLDYLSERPVAAGQLLRVPLGRREVLGVVWGAGRARGEFELKPVGAAFDLLPPLPRAWIELVDFAARYYQRGIGELALAALPPELRTLDPAGLARRLTRVTSRRRDAAGAASDAAPALNPAQADAVAAIGAALAERTPAPLLLQGVTGSGKTEVYLHAAAATLDAGRQALILVPEINLTPQLEARFVRRFPGRTLVALHSGLTPARRLAAWLLAHLGHADIVLGTRLAVFAPLSRMGLIVVDEEHDPSYKQQEGARYSARDLAVYRARLEGVPVVLGSATPSLESWQRASQGRYRRVRLDQRIGGGELPRVRLFDLGALPRSKGAPPPVLAPPVLAAMQQRLADGQQSLVFLNRRGYAPVLHCADCGWMSACPNCSAWRVFHKSEPSLRCHHCGLADPVPRACPECGNLDIAAIGRGTERLEEQLGALLPGARIARLDADAVRGAGKLERRLAEVHAGEVDVLVGTQMLTKGHDFRRVTLVVAVNPDGALFAADFRAPERLFALLMQAAGRAGRDAAAGPRGEMWVQTWHPTHPLYRALQRHDVDAFAAAQLAERRAAGLPPFSHLALLRAEARDAAVGQAFLRAAAEAAAALPDADAVTIYPPVPPVLNRVAGLERLQMLAESASRTRLQRFLAQWVPLLHALRREHKSLARWAIDVDPLAI
jgi:primosomal protein N' (replication factor Y)